MLNTAVSMQSALGTAKTITGISKATEAIVTATHDFSVGDFIVIDGVAGMVEINKRVIRIKAVSTTVSFTCEGLDSTAFSTWASGGTASKVSTFLAFDNATSFSYPEPAPNRLDATTIHLSAKREIFGLDEAPQLSMNLLADPTAAHVVEMKAASIAKTTRVFKVTLQTGVVLLFNAYVSGGRGLDGSGPGAIATSSVALALAAPEQYFSS
jgi:hypothetical protein